MLLLNSIIIIIYFFWKINIKLINLIIYLINNIVLFFYKNFILFIIFTLIINFVILNYIVGFFLLFLILNFWIKLGSIFIILFLFVWIISNYNYWQLSFLLYIWFKNQISNKILIFIRNLILNILNFKIYQEKNNNWIWNLYNFNDLYMFKKEERLLLKNLWYNFWLNIIIFNLQYNLKGKISLINNIILNKLLYLFSFFLCEQYFIFF